MFFTPSQPGFVPQGNQGLPNLQYQPKYQAKTNLQQNTNWLQGLPNLNALFNPNERFTELTDRQESGQGTESTEGGMTRGMTNNQGLLGALLGGLSSTTPAGFAMSLAAFLGSTEGREAASTGFGSFGPEGGEFGGLGDPEANSEGVDSFGGGVGDTPGGDAEGAGSEGSGESDGGGAPGPDGGDNAW